MKTHYNQLIIVGKYVNPIFSQNKLNQSVNIQRVFKIVTNSLCLFFLLVFNHSVCLSSTYRSIANGNWSNSSTWQGGSIPPSTLPAGDSVFVRHSVTYNLSNNMEMNGVLWIEPVSGFNGSLTIINGRNVEIGASGKFIVRNGTFLQRRFTSGNDGQPYSGNNPGATSQSGNFTNKGGYINILNSYVEVAQNWNSENGGVRIIRNGCLFTGQNYSLTGSASKDTLDAVTVSVGWHGSGNFEVSDASLYFNMTRIQIAGTSGHFKLNSGNVNGDIDYIALKNQVGSFIGSGNIEVSSSVNNSPSLNLDAYCATSSSNLIHNSKFSGNRSYNCGLNYFPGSCNGTPLAPLNIKLVNFKAIRNANDHISLDWSTLNETNNRHFEVQRSYDGRNWTNLSIIKGAGNSNEMKDYRFIDEVPLNGVNFYRLKTLDYNDKVELSSVQMVIYENSSNSEISIFPNPGSSVINLKINNENPDGSDMAVSLINSMGQTMPLEFTFYNGYAQFDVTNIPAGLYFVKSEMNSVSRLIPLVVEH